MRYSFLVALFIFFLVPALTYAGTDVRTYEIPDVREVFCGAQMPPFYCKCAFHNQGCDGRGLDQDGANEYVLSEFREWNRKNIQNMGEQCLKRDGYWDKGEWSCTYCTDGDVLNGTRCVKPEKVDPAKNECTAALAEFGRDWEKYSDFDDRLGSDVSYEVGQFNATLDEIGNLIAKAHELEYQMALSAEIRLEMREYKAALVQNIRNNITKAIFRLAWVTYNTVQGAKGSDGTIEKLLDPQNAVQQLGATMKLIQSNIPPHEKSLQFDGSKTSGKVGSIAWNATLEAMESVGDPVEVAKQAMKDVKGAIVPGPDISEEEVAILREQHLSNKAVDEALADSYAEAAAMRAELLRTERLIVEKYNELEAWKQKEFERVKNSLEDQCKDEI